MLEGHYCIEKTDLWIWILALILFNISALFRAFDQTIRYKRWDRSWIPARFFTWSTRLYILDADHTYMGLKLFFLACGMAYVGYFVPFWWVFPVVLLIMFGWYYVAFNYHFHVTIPKGI